MALLTVNGIVRVGTDPELRFSPSGMAVCSFRAVASKSKKVGDDWETTHEMWFSVTAFGKLAEFTIESGVVKGGQINLLGEIYEEEWETNDGEKRKAVKVIANGLNPLPPRDGQRSSGGQSQQRQQSSGGQQPPEDPWGPPPGQEEPPF